MLLALAYLDALMQLPMNKYLNILSLKFKIFALLSLSLKHPRMCYPEYSSPLDQESYENDLVHQQLHPFIHSRNVIITSDTPAHLNDTPENTPRRPPPEISMICICCLVNRLSLISPTTMLPQCPPGQRILYMARRVVATGRARQVQLRPGCRYLIVTPFTSPASSSLSDTTMRRTRRSMRDISSAVNAPHDQYEQEMRAHEQRDFQRYTDGALCGLYELTDMQHTQSMNDSQSLRRLMSTGTGFVVALPPDRSETSPRTYRIDESDYELPVCRCEIVKTKALVMRHLVAEVLHTALMRIRTLAFSDCHSRRSSSQNQSLVTPLSKNWNFLDAITNAAALETKLVPIPQSTENELLEVIRTSRTTLLKLLHLVPSDKSMESLLDNSVPALGQPQISSTEVMSTLQMQTSTYSSLSTPTSLLAEPRPFLFTLNNYDESFLHPEVCFATELTIDERAKASHRDLTQIRARVSLLSAIVDMFRVMAKAAEMRPDRPEEGTPQEVPHEPSQVLSDEASSSSSIEEEPGQQQPPQRNALTDIDAVRAELISTKQSAMIMESIVKMTKSAQKAVRLFSQTFPAPFDETCGSACDQLEFRFRLKTKQQLNILE